MNEELHREITCYRLLAEVMIEQGYSTIVADKTLRGLKPQDKAYITKLFYGVLEKSVEFDYVIKEVAPRPPQKPVAILLKIGLYLMKYMNVPPYAAINKTVALSKSVGKAGVSGFINAVLRKSGSVKLPENNLSVKLSCPQWIVDKLLARYDAAFAEQMLSAGERRKHIRRNANRISAEDFERQLAQFEKTRLGYYADFSMLEPLDKRDYTYQSLSSMLAVRAYLSGQSFDSVLDVCSAPGGKALYLKELCPDTAVTCSDLHPHRVELIKRYAERMGLKFAYAVHDATLLNPEWCNKFALVICDAPCSGLGVKTKPDIMLNRREEDIQQLAELQYEILSISSKYVREGGVLAYSTCTFLKEENEDVVARFLSQNPSFTLTSIASEYLDGKGASGMLNLYPQDFGSDGFFVARLLRTE